MDSATPSATTLALDFLVSSDAATMSARALCRACALMGHDEPAARVALTRLVRQGKIEKRGRAAYGLARGGDPLSADVENWRARLDWLGDWGGGWVAVQEAGAGGRDRTALRRHRRALALRGFRRWTPGLYLRPDNLRGGAPALRVALGELGLAREAVVFVASGFEGAAARAVAGLWDCAGLRAAQARMREAALAGLARLGGSPPEAAAREALLNGRDWIAQLLRDPLLPPQMLDGADYPALFGALARYQDESRALWNRLLADD